MQGVLIHASVRCTLIYKFQSKIKEDKVYTIQSFSVSCNDGSYRTTNNAYKINFQFGTKVNLVECTLVLKSSTTYTPFSTITAPGFDTDYLVSKYLLFFFFFFVFNFSFMLYFVIVLFFCRCHWNVYWCWNRERVRERWQEDQDECHPY